MRRSPHYASAVKAAISVSVALMRLELQRIHIRCASPPAASQQKHLEPFQEQKDGKVILAKKSKKYGLSMYIVEVCIEGG